MVDTVFYNEMAQTALELLTDMGRDDLVLSRKIGGGYDPATDTEVPGSTITSPMKCVVLPVEPSASDSVEEGTLIASSMRLLKVAAEGMVFVPASADTVAFEGVQWLVLSATPINPAGIPLVYNVMVKRS